MSEEKKDAIADKKVSRRSMLKWTGALAAAVVVGVGAGYETNQILRPITEFTTTEILPLAYEENRYTAVTSGGPAFVYVSKGRIIRMDPMFATEEDLPTPWNVTAGGKTFTLPRKNPLASWATASRRAVYSPDRGRYPMKRVDWNPDGARNPQNRGKSDYVRISWNEAYDTITKEITRILQKYGNSAILAQTVAHNEWGLLHYWREFSLRFLPCMGGCTMIDSPNVSWEGWTYGAEFMYGYYWNNGMIGQRDCLDEMMRNSQAVILWGTDPILNSMIYTGHDIAVPYFWFKDLGKRILAVDPVYNETASVYADKWIPIIPGTDSAMLAAIAYTWINEGTYDKDYLNTHTVGFDEDHLQKGVPPNSSFKSYIMGLVDGVPKTPDWAAAICGVKAREIKALAKEWASKPTAVVAYFSGACRTDFAHEYTRMMTTLQAMQGLGKPGVYLALGSLTSGGLGKSDVTQLGPPSYAVGGGGMNYASNKFYPNPVTQWINDTLVDKALYEAPISWRGGSIMPITQAYSTNQPFTQTNQYPKPGFSEIKMIWNYGASTLHTKAEISTRAIKVFQCPNVEFNLVQNPWFESDCLYADIYLPINMQYEHIDVSEPGSYGRTPADPGSGWGSRLAVYHQKCIDSLFESKSDLEIGFDLSGMLGFKDKFTEGKTEEDYVRVLYSKSNIPMTYDQFKEKGYYYWPNNPSYKPLPEPTWFYNMPTNADFVKNGLITPSGKIEILPQQLFEFYGANDPVVPPTPRYIPVLEGRYSHPLVDKYPLQLLSKHPKFRYHGKYDGISWLRELSKVKGKDGKEYEPILMNPADAQARGLKNGDIVRVFNDRGQILCGVQITERITPQVVSVSYGSWPNLAQPGTRGSLDRAGNSNFLTSTRPISKHELGAARDSALVQVESWSGQA